MRDHRSQLTRALLISRSINILSTFFVTLPRPPRPDIFLCPKTAL
jgi:Importin 13 repeat